MWQKALPARFLRGALPPVDFFAVCLVRGIEVTFLTGGKDTSE
jgi:hypothetical protein